MGKRKVASDKDVEKEDDVQDRSNTSKCRSKSKSKGEKVDRSSTRDFIYSSGKPSNDPKWYLNNAALARDVGSIWFSRPTGENIPSSALGRETNLDLSVFDPGILVLDTILTWGGNTHADQVTYSGSALNVSANKLYQYVVHANSRNTTYDAKSLMMSVMAVDAIYQVITEAIRVYRLVSQNSFENKYIRRLVSALGWDVAACQSSVAQFRYYINLAINRVNKFFVPMLFDVIRAHQASYENIYLDRPSIKGQIIATRSCGIWEYRAVDGELVYTNYVDTTSVGGTAPSKVTWANTRTPNDFHYVVSAMLNNVESAQYMGVMQGDMLKAFGMGAMMQYNYVGIDEAIYPIYDEEFIFKLHNAEIPDVGTFIAAYVKSKFTTFDTELLKYRDDRDRDGGIYCIHKPWNPSNGNHFSMYQVHFIDLASDLPNTAETTLLMTLYKKHWEYMIGDRWEREGEVIDNIVVSDLNPEEILNATLYFKPDFVTPRYVSSYTPLPSVMLEAGYTTWLAGTGNNISRPYPTVDFTDTAAASAWMRLTDAFKGFISRFRKHPIIQQQYLTYTNGGTTTSTVLPFIWDTDNFVYLSDDELQRCNYVIWWSLWASSIIGNIS